MLVWVWVHEIAAGMQKLPAHANEPKVRKAVLAGLALHEGDPNPQAASKKLAEHHEMQLLSLGINMGNDGCQMLDLRPFEELLELHTGEV